MAATTYDAIVIGAGQAGGPLARAFATAGRRTALVERSHVGGTCVNEGCTPTKTMVASARVAYLARRAADYGVQVGPVSVDLARVRQRKRDIVESFRGGSEKGLHRDGVDLLMGEARFTAPHSVRLTLNDGGQRDLSAPLVFINTGARPARPPLPGLDMVKTLDSTTIMELDRVPEHLLVLGGGYIGLEFGQMFRRFGSRVSIVQRAAHLLANEDDDVAEALAQILREDGIEVLLNATARQVGSEGGTIRLTVATTEGERELAGTHLLLAAGRVPNTDRLDLVAAGINMDKKGFILVNDRLQTNIPGHYALGDVKGGPAFTHISYDDYRVVRDNLLRGGNSTTKGRLVPYTMFTDPQLARVGLSEQEARKQGLHVQVARMPMSYVARALEIDEPRGLMKAVVDADTGQILGFTVLGVEGGELMAVVQMAMMGKLPYTVLREAVFAHPTLAESLNNLFANLAT
jgi:pyruvate/2-oxoglutarate dehydrogenase complex dihydrolipoamide dehydrogenase (E3) component